MANNTFNPDAVGKYYDLLGHKRETEIRPFDPNRKGAPQSIFVINRAEFIRVCLQIQSLKNIYAGLNERTPGGTKQADVVSLNLIPIDIDVKKERTENDGEISDAELNGNKCAANDAELAKAIAKAEEITAALTAESYEIGGVAMTGNGVRILLPLFPAIQLTAENRASVAANLKEFGRKLGERFDDEHTKIDQTVFEFARIDKVIGTLSIKGANLPHRPHRLTYWISYNGLRPNEKLRAQMLEIQPEATPAQNKPKKAGEESKPLILPPHIAKELDHLIKSGQIPSNKFGKVEAGGRHFAYLKVFGHLSEQGYSREEIGRAIQYFNATKTEHPKSFEDVAEEIKGISYSIRSEVAPAKYAASAKELEAELDVLKKQTDERELPAKDMVIIVAEMVKNDIKTTKQFREFFKGRYEFADAGRIERLKGLAIEERRKIRNPKSPIEQTDEEPKKPQNTPPEIIAILKDPTLFERITVLELGKKIVGEVSTRQTIFTCACGKYVANASPTSYNILANANAGAGKDYTVNATLEIFPKKDYLKRTRISPTALTYWHNSEKEPNWNWDGKILNLEDVSQNVLDSDVVKVFLSSSSYATIVVNQETKDIKINGKPIVFFTSATVKLNPEQMRRIPMIQMDESKDHTKEIMKKQAKVAAEGGSIEYDENLTIALSRLERVKVLVPFAGGIEAAIEATHIILRTHFPRFLDYIKAITALYQFQRKRTANGFLIAERADYEFARIAMETTTSNKFFVPLSHEQKRLIEIIENLQKEVDKLAEEKKATEQVKLTEKEKNSGQKQLDVVEVFGVDAGEIAAKVDFWGETMLYQELGKLSQAGILLLGKIRKPDAKKPVKTYRVLEHEKIILPTWEQICGKSGIDEGYGIDEINGINGIDNKKTVSDVEQQNNKDNVGESGTNNSIKNINSINFRGGSGHTHAQKSEEATQS